MKHFTIFRNFYRIIAEMTEEEIVSTISSSKYQFMIEDKEWVFFVIHDCLFLFYPIKLLKINGLSKGKPHFYSLEIKKLHSRSRNFVGEQGVWKRLYLCVVNKKEMHF